ncbi:hypothetical protein [Streptococcus uberis]|uniref:hypothetical protein n=1 Tax=Streptococcus uberis TaxID=1349 RepID=UPI000E02A69F|nr:hypothetical protein [Streptococcus uberis]SUO89526.1 Lipoprotein involved in the synthesis of group B streptococcal carboyhdrate antigen [Streptococcus uberis]
MTKKIFILFSFLLLLTGCKVEKTDKESYPKTNISVYYYYNNEPRKGIHVEAFNYETAYRKIQSGKFRNIDFTHYTIDGVKKKYSVSNNKIILDNYQFGQGIKNNAKDAKAIIRILFENSMDYLNFMNGLKPEVTLSNPDNGRYKFSNNEGKLVGQVETGLTLLRDTTGTGSYKMTRIKNNDVIYVGNTRPLKKPITVNEKVVKEMTTDYGQTITYKIPITSEKISVRLSPNFVVDSSNLIYTSNWDPIVQKNVQNGELVTDEDNPIIVNGLVEYRSKKVKMDAKDAKFMAKDLSVMLSRLQSITRLDFNIKDSSEKELIIKGHISAKAPYNVPILLEKSDDQTEQMTKTIDVYSSQLNQGLYVSDSQSNIISPTIQSYGINFVTYDASTNKPKTAPAFLLGKVEKGKVYILEDEGNQTVWKKTNFSMKKLLSNQKDSHYHQIEAGKYNYVDGQSRSMDLNYELWNFDEKEQNKEHHALIKVRGLAKNKKYFLLALETNKTVNGNQPYYFKVNQDSIAQASKSNYQINGYISDMTYGKEEYNAIPIVAKKGHVSKPINPLLFTLLVVGLVTLLYVTVTILLIKKI